MTISPELEKEFEDLALAYSEAVAKECTTHAELVFATNDMMDCIQGYINYHLSLTAQEMNAESKFMTTNPPQDVFAHVCDYLTLAERITVSHVSHYWRELAISDARLWNHVVQGHTDSTGARHLLERSRNTPVHLELTVYDTNAKDHASYIVEHLHHVKTLILRFPESRGGDVTQSAWSAISYAIARPAPVLETLYINVMRSAYHMDGNETPGNTLRPDFLAGFAPQLRHVSIGGVLLPKSAGDEPLEPFAHVAELSYAHRNGVALTGADLSTLTENFPRIERLALSSQTFTDDGTDVRKLPGLRVVDAVVGQGMEAALRRLNFEATHLTSIRNNVHDPSMMVPVLAEHSRATSISASMSDLAVAGVDEFGAPHERRFFSLGLDPIKRTLEAADMFRSLQSLLLHEFLWPHTGLLPAAPQLRELSVVLALASEHRNWLQGGHHHPMMGMGGMGDEPQGMITLFQLPAELAIPWNCSSLRTFRLIFGGWQGGRNQMEQPNERERESGPRVVSAGDVLRFVETYLAAALPLGRIELKGVQIYESPHEIRELQALMNNATEFSVEDAGNDPNPQTTGMWETYYGRGRLPDRNRRRAAA
ncbi:hypothetical protein BKA62DRAFT_630603 [Auriculariales sp. MPI-PUGE-AT-0066]|nr:hypothetical protein BKA62DRAFT_630603 [Auriculariales sp. MPI-PUGE-AT-0066]